VAEALETPDGVGDAAAVVLLTNVFRRYSARYRNRGYRYALIDSGHIGENLRLAARSLGLRETAPLRFHDDALSALLGIDGREEAVCAVHALGALGPPPAPAAARTWVEKQRLDAGAREGGGPVTRRYHEATKLVPAADPGDARPPAAAGSAAPPAEAAALTLSMGPAPQLPLEDAILGRRSPDGFAARPVSAADLAFVLRAAGGQPALQRAPGVDLYVFAHRVTGVAPGLYRSGPGSERLSLLRSGDLRRTLVEVCWGQAMAGSSAAALVMVARFEVSDSRLGTRHYRDQLLEAGSIGQRVYLAAEALGLAARNLAAFLDDDLNGLLGLDPRRAGAVHLTVFGSEGA
jgi:SagB-type dehydrogenase family enzyme